MREVIRTEGGIYLDGKFTSDEAIRDIKDWADIDPALVLLIFGGEE